MKRQSILPILLLLLAFVACTDDNSRYVILDKEDVEVDGVFGPEPEETFDPNVLNPGMHRVTLQVEGVAVPNRSFKYYFPISLNPGRPISLIFNFHGNYTYEGDQAPDPILNISSSDPLCQVADTANCIVVYPAGLDEGGSVGWQGGNYLSSIPFVDAIVRYFEERSPRIDMNRIYTCGHSSGAIFSYVLATERSELFAAAVPVSGQRKLDGTEKPARIMPIRAFNGVQDASVNYAGALQNITTWADQLGGYYPKDVILEDSIEIKKYSSGEDVYTLTPHVWRNGRADIEFWAIPEEGHSISWGAIIPYIWEFMKSHTLDMPEKLYAAVEYDTLNMSLGAQQEMGYRNSAGGSIRLSEAPKGWTVTVSGGKIKVVAPASLANGNAWEGKIVFVAEGSGESREVSCFVQIKNWYDVGDVVYDADDQPCGIVYWVDPSDKKSAKILSLIRWKGIPWGVALNTGDANNGEKNTDIIVAQAKVSGLSEDQCAALKCSNYAAGGTGWYLPALNEFKGIFTTDVSKKINEILTTLGGDLFTNAERDVWSSYSAGGKYYVFDYQINGEWSYADHKTTIPVTRAIKKVRK